MSDSLTQRYKDEGIDPITGAFCLIDGKVYMTVAGMEIKAMRSGVLAGKGSVVFSTDEIEPANPFTGEFARSPRFATATYSRLIMDTPREFSSDPVSFREYAKKQWHFEKPFMFLAKIARACALRHAFPDIFAGVVSYEEAQSELNFGDKDIPKTADILTREYMTKPDIILPTPDSIKDMVTTVFGKKAVTE